MTKSRYERLCEHLLPLHICVHAKHMKPLGVWVTNEQYKCVPACHTNCHTDCWAAAASAATLLFASVPIVWRVTLRLPATVCRVHGKPQLMHCWYSYLNFFSSVVTGDLHTTHITTKIYKLHASIACVRRKSFVSKAKKKLKKIIWKLCTTTR